MAAVRSPGLQPRQLSPEEEQKLSSERVLVSDFKQQQLEKEAQKNWDLFYKRNSTHFFKDRHWTSREFGELKACREFENQKLTILEAGCGVGNCLFPLLEDLNIFAYACDFSPRAVEYVKQNPLYDPARCQVFQCDLTADDLLAHVPPASVDAVLLVFMLSAVHPGKMRLVLRNLHKVHGQESLWCARYYYTAEKACSEDAGPAQVFREFMEELRLESGVLHPWVLKPGRSVLFRDYGLYDHAMLRFKAGNKLGENFYVRQDGTRSYFFTKELLAQLFADTGYEEVVNEYVLRETVNKKEGLCVPRVFLQSKFRKSPESGDPAAAGLGRQAATHAAP